MTRNEAKEILQAVKFLLPIEAYTDRAEEALDVAIEALERPHGENISEDGFLCSVCTFGDFGGFHGYEPNFCPNCGADMRGYND